MKKISTKLTLLMVPFLLVGCSQAASVNSEVSSNANVTTSSVAGKSSSSDKAKSSSNNGPIGRSSSSSSKPVSSSSIGPHEHKWSTTWDYDDSKHWQTCSACNEKKDEAAHTLGEWQDDVDLGTLLNNPNYKYTTVKARKCATCNYFEVGEKDSVLPEVRITYDPNDPNANFATKAKSTDVNRPKIAAKVSISNCPSAVAISNKDVEALKVRGNQTAGFPKKGLSMKFESKINLLGLNGGQRFKKWILLADAKDCTVSRTALGLTMSNSIIRDDSKVWASEFKPVSVYLNDTYWGMYFLAEQKESKEGRIKLEEPEAGYEGVDIGYCFELDHYAEQEPKKLDGGDPTFNMSYGSNYDNKKCHDIENNLANSGSGPMTHFTMNSDITDGPEQPTDEELEAGTKKAIPVNASNSNQVKFIQNRMTALFKVLEQAAVSNKAYTINDSNTAVAATGKTPRQCVEENFNLKAWAEGFIINAIACPPDVGYSSFYMSFDNTPTGDKKLRFDCPWDFDSNFGNRRNLCEGGDSGQKDPYYLDRTSNLWLQMLSKLDFFIDDYVKPLWNEIREERVFENCIEMLKIYYKVYANENKKNFTKWTSIDPDDQNVLSYWSGELRDVFKKVDETNRKKAQKETINWFSKRVNYFENRWGENRANLQTI